MKLIKKLINHPLFSGSAIVFVGNMTANVVNYLYHLIMGRMLGPVEYGVLASLYSVLYLVGIIPSSASVSIVKFISSAKDREVFSVYHAINKLIFKLALFLSVVTIILSPFIAKFLHINSLTSVILVAPILFFMLVTLVNQSASQGLLKFVGFVVPILISSISKLMIGVLLVFMGWSIFGAMTGVLIAAILAYFYSFSFIKKHLKITIIKDVNLKPFVNYSGPVLIQALAFTSIFTIDVILAKHFLDPFSAGIYAALSTLGKIIFFAASPVASTMFPVISKRKSSNQGYLKVFVASFLITFSIAGLATLFFWLFPDLTIGILYGKDYLSAKGDLVWMACFILFYTLSNLLVNFFLSIGKVKVVVLPLIFAIAQGVIIWFYHKNITEIIHVSLFTTLALFVCLSLYTGYNLLYEEKNN